MSDGTVQTLNIVVDPQQEPIYDSTTADPQGKLFNYSQVQCKQMQMCVNVFLSFHGCCCGFHRFEGILNGSLNVKRDWTNET